MTAVTVQLPESLHRAIRELAEQEGYSVEQFLASAAAEKSAAIKTVDYLRREAAHARLEDFDRMLSMVPDVPPEPGDELPSQA